MPGARPGVLGPVNNAVEAASAQEFSEQVAFSVADIPYLPFAAEHTAYTAWGGLAEIDYAGEGQTALYRKSEGTGDNSGDYNKYEGKAEITLGGFSIT